MTISLRVDNLKCGGCAATVTRQLESLAGINYVKVLPEQGEIDLDYTDLADLDQVKQKLHDLGYPESGTTQGLDKITSNIKSYVSCAIGRFSGESKGEEDDKSHAHK